MLFDHEADPYQMNNLIDAPDYADVRSALGTELERWLQERGDAFLNGADYLKAHKLEHYREVQTRVTRTWRSPWDEPAS
jgi:hypothetical protein